MNVLIMGGGGREHAVAWALKASPLLSRLICAPGGVGTARIAESASFDPADRAACVAFCRRNAVSLASIDLHTRYAADLDAALSAAGVRVFGSPWRGGSVTASNGAAHEPQAVLYVLCDGTTALPFGTVQERVGALGAETVSPAPLLEDVSIDRTMDSLIFPLLARLRTEGTAYRGLLSARLARTRAELTLLDASPGFGAGHAQVLLPRLKDDLLPLLIGAVDGMLSRMAAQWRDEAAVRLTRPVEGCASGIEGFPNAVLFQGDSSFDVVALGAGLDAARALAYRAAESIRPLDGVRSVEDRSEES